MTINWAPVQTWPAREHPQHRAPTTNAPDPRPAAHPKGRVPRKSLVVVMCMDVRLQESVLGLKPGDAHILRNAGGLVTADVLKGIAVSQVEMGTTRILLVQHTDCGALGLDQQAFTRSMTARARRGVPPKWTTSSAATPTRALAENRRIISQAHYLPHRNVDTAIYDVSTHHVRAQHSSDRHA